MACGPFSSGKPKEKGTPGHLGLQRMGRGIFRAKLAFTRGSDLSRGSLGDGHTEYDIFKNSKILTQKPVLPGFEPMNLCLHVHSYTHYTMVHTAYRTIA